ncbi:hypothetical protein X777_13910 [Ooceraea biroi]|uniref:Uncharacterized protein n=1 Tax=Ooceraea biroi TaxID=2015173 RepID=A0A026WVK7_OOCBI|nr:hypothetical protein X777_13910 [Ooceraea biroi]
MFKILKTYDVFICLQFLVLCCLLVVVHGGWIAPAPLRSSWRHLSAAGIVHRRWELINNENIFQFFSLDEIWRQENAHQFTTPAALRCLQDDLYRRYIQIKK